MKRQQRNNNDDKMARLVRRNWIICGVSLALAVAAYFIFR